MWFTYWTIMFPFENSGHSLSTFRPTHWGVLFCLRIPMFRAHWYHLPYGGLGSRIVLHLTFLNPLQKMLILVDPASLLTNVTTNIAKRVYFRNGGDRGIETDMSAQNKLETMWNINSIQLAFVSYYFCSHLLPKINAWLWLTFKARLIVKIKPFL